MIVIELDGWDRMVSVGLCYNHPQNLLLLTPWKISSSKLKV